MNSQEYKIQFQTYVGGFILSMFLTIVAFSLVLENLLSGNSLIVALLMFAVAQAWVQMVFFLHMGSGAQWKRFIFASTFGLILIVVIGSLWIMAHLNYNMSPDQMNTYMEKSEGMAK